MNRGSWFRRALSRAITGLGGVRVGGADNNEPYFPPQAIYYSNHSSHLDFLTLWAVMPPQLQPRVRPIAAADYWGSGIKSQVAQGVFNAHLVHRGKSAPTPSGSGRQASFPNRHTRSGVSPRGQGQLAGMTAILDAGDSLLIFPEGTRGAHDAVADFQAGLYRLAAHDPSIPVVPVTLKNLGRILPKGEMIPVPHLTTVIVHEPLSLEPNESQQEFLTRARQILVNDLVTADDADADGKPAGRPNSTPDNEPHAEPGPGKKDPDDV